MQAAIFWPIRFASASYVLRVAYAGGAAQSVTISVTAGRNYWMSGDGQADSDGGVGGIGDLLAVIRTALQTVNASFNVTLTSSFRVQVTAASTFTLSFADGSNTFDETILGYTDGLSVGPSTSITAPNLPHGIWRPKKWIAVDSRERQPIVGAIATAISGLQRTSRLATPKKERDLDWRLLEESVILQEYSPADEPTGSFEYAWRESLSYGRPWRFYSNETSRTSTSFALYVVRELDEPYERNAQWILRWSVSLKARRA